MVHLHMVFAGHAHNSGTSAEMANALSSLYKIPHLQSSQSLFTLIEGEHKQGLLRPRLIIHTMSSSLHYINQSNSQSHVGASHQENVITA